MKQFSHDEMQQRRVREANLDRAAARDEEAVALQARAVSAGLPRGIILSWTQHPRVMSISGGRNDHGLHTPDHRAEGTVGRAFPDLAVT